MKPNEQLWHYIVGWNSNTFGSKVYPPIMCITFPGYISVVSLFSGIHFSCILALTFDLPTQSDTYICICNCSKLNYCIYIYTYIYIYIYIYIYTHMTIINILPLRNTQKFKACSFKLKRSIRVEQKEIQWHFRWKKPITNTC